MGSVRSTGGERIEAGSGRIKGWGIKNVTKFYACNNDQSEYLLQIKIKIQSIRKN